MADTIIEREHSSNTGTIVAVVAVVILVLAAIFVLPGLFNASTGDNTGTSTTTTVPTPTITTPTTGE